MKKNAPTARKQKEIRLRRGIIIDAAEKIFYEQGYENATMQDIAKAAEYTKMSLYSYFSSKEEIYIAVYNRGLKKRLEFLRSRMAGVKTGLEGLRTFARAYYDFYREYPAILRFQLYLDYHGMKSVELDEELVNEYGDLNQEGLLLIQKPFAMGLEDGSMNFDAGVEIISRHFIVSLRSILNLVILHADETYIFVKEMCSPEEFYRSYVEHFIRGIETR